MYVVHYIAKNNETDCRIIEKAINLIVKDGYEFICFHTNDAGMMGCFKKKANQIHKPITDNKVYDITHKNS